MEIIKNQHTNLLKHKTTTSFLIYLFTSTLFFSNPFTLKFYSIQTQPQPPSAEEFNHLVPLDYKIDATYSEPSNITNFSLPRIISCNPKSNFIIVSDPQVASYQQQ